MPDATVSFNNRPINVDTITSGTYTVPANTFARVVCQVENGGYITINGKIVLTDNLTTGVIASLAANGTLYTVPANRFFEGQLTFPGGFTGVLKEGVTDFMVNGASGPVSLKLGSNFSLAVSSYSSGRVTLTGFLRAISGSTTAEFWVKAADQVAIVTSGRITYMEYTA